MEFGDELVLREYKKRFQDAQVNLSKFGAAEPVWVFSDMDRRSGPDYRTTFWHPTGAPRFGPAPLHSLFLKMGPTARKIIRGFSAPRSIEIAGTKVSGPFDPFSGSAFALAMRKCDWDT